MQVERLAAAGQESCGTLGSIPPAWHKIFSYTVLSKNESVIPVSVKVICNSLSCSSTGEFEVMFANTEVHKIVHISKTNEDNPNL